MPRDPRAYLQRAEEHRRHGRLKEAIALSIEALGKHPNLDAVRVTLGRAYLENAQPEEARTTLHEVFGRQPSHHLAGKFLIESQRLLGDLAGAAATCRTLLEHYPRDREIEPLLSEIVRAQSSPETAGAPPPPALKAAATPALKAVAAPMALEDEADPQPDYLPEDLGTPRSPAPMTGASSESQSKAPAPISAASAPAPTAFPAPATPPGLSTAQIDRAIEAARPPIPTPAPAPKASSAMPAATMTAAPPPPPIAAKSVVSEPPVPPRPIAAAPVVPTPVASMPLPAPVPAPKMEMAAPAPAAPAATPAPDSAAAASSVAGAATKRDALETNTLAELYVKQGLPDRAIEVYRSMLRVEPGNIAARQRLAELEAAAAAAPAPAARPAPVKPATPETRKPSAPPSTKPAMAPASKPVVPTAAPSADASPVSKANSPVAMDPATSEPTRVAPAAPLPHPVPMAAAPSPAPAPVAAPAPVGAPATPAVSASASPRQAHPNRAAIDRLERWLDTVKRGQKSLDGGAAA